MHPGPGVDGPGPGVMMWAPPAPAPAQADQVAFVRPEGMLITWDVTAPGAFDSEPLVVPGRYNFPEGAIYRLKLTNVPGRPGVELYPTLEIGPTKPRTAAFLAHNAIPVEFTQEDFDQVLSGNFVTKVIYLPDPEFQELALAGVDTLVSTRLDPGVDPIVEADRRGAILAIVRLGNKDLQVHGAGGMPPGMMTGPNGMMMGPNGLPCPAPGAPMMAMGGPNGYVSGVTGPQYGMPMTGTPIGLPGPPHVPLGIQAGLQRHTIVNHTRSDIPGPENHVRIDVKQKPGFSYPQPANHARIVEKASENGGAYHEPLANRHQSYPGVQPTAPGVPCPPGAAADGPAATN